MSEFEPKYRITVEKQAQDGSWEAAPALMPVQELKGFLLMGYYDDETIAEIVGYLSRGKIITLLAQGEVVSQLLPLAMMRCALLGMMKEGATANE